MLHPACAARSPILGLGLGPAHAHDQQMGACLQATAGCAVGQAAAARNQPPSQAVKLAPNQPVPKR